MVVHTAASPPMANTTPKMRSGFTCAAARALAGRTGRFPAVEAREPAFPLA